MKISQQDLESGKISSGNISAETIAKLKATEKPKGELTYDTKKGTLNRGDPDGIYQPEVFQYAIDRGLRIAENMKQAISLRYDGALVFTIREIDIMARSKMDVENELLRKIFMDQEAGFILTEPIDRDGIHVFKLRELYNRGLQWVNTLRATATEDKKKMGDDAIKDAIYRMGHICNLPPWPGEIEKGFPVELTKPECYNWDQWNKMRDQVYQQSLLV